MYVDRVRFALEPEALAGANDGPIRGLFRGARGKAGMVVRLLRDLPSIRNAYRALGNRESRALFRDLLRYRVLGPYYTRIANNKALHDAVEAVLAEDIASEPLDEPMTDVIGQPVRSWSIQYHGRPMTVLGAKTAVFAARDSDQYYYRVGDVRVQPEEGDVLLDGGTYLGEMALRFAVDVGPAGRVISFDPFARHAALATEIARKNGLEDRAQFMAAGLGARSTIRSLDEARVDPNRPMEDVVNAGRKVVATDPIVTIDDFCAWSGLERVDYIKMDIEGWEIPALEGSHATISRWRPKLAVCLYHRYDDLWKITNMIRRLYPFYDLFLGHYTVHGEETVLYARARPEAV